MEGSQAQMHEFFGDMKGLIMDLATAVQHHDSALSQLQTQVQQLSTSPAFAFEAPAPASDVSHASLASSDSLSSRPLSPGAQDLDAYMSEPEITVLAAPVNYDSVHVSDM